MPTQLTSLVHNIHIYTPAEIENALQQYNSDRQHTQEREEKEHTERENNTERKKKHNTQSGDFLPDEITRYSSSSTAYNEDTLSLNVSSVEERNGFSSFSVLTLPTLLSHTHPSHGTLLSLHSPSTNSLLTSPVFTTHNTPFSCCLLL